MFLRMTRTRALLLGILWFGAMETGSRLLAGDEPSQPPKPGVLFAGRDLPLPPQQGRPWTPPASKLPEKWITAFQELLRHGFADPRGCEYREVKLTCGSSIWGGSFLTSTHAWIIPKAPGEKEGSQRFAVTWDGLVYPVAELGPPKDLKADVETLIKGSDKLTDQYKDHPFGFGGSIQEFPVAYNCPNHMRDWSESELVSCGSLLALKTCLLFRLGEGQLAERLWDTWKHRDSAALGMGPPGEDPYMVFAWEWAWALFDRAVGAHLRGDDVIAMHTGKILVPFAEAVPKVAAKRRFSQLENYGSGKPIPYLPLRDPPARLLAESTRRVQAGPFRTALDIGLAKFPKQSERIAALIRDLETISAGPGYEEGMCPLSPPRIGWNTMGMNFGHPPENPLKVSPVVQALIKEGPPAVEPLLECLVNDRRLTRVAGLSPSTCGDFLEGRDFIGVDLAAYTALCGILQADGFGPLTEEGYYHGCQGEPDAESSNPPALPFYVGHGSIGDPSLERRRAVAAEIRRRWERIKGRRPEEAWLAVLADPEMTCALWLDAAQKIVAPVGQPPATAAEAGANDVPVVEDALRPMAGEALRGMKNPSVTELLARRSDESADLAKRQEPHFFDWAPVCDLTLCLAQWDPKAAVPVIHRRITELRRPMRSGFPFGSQGLDYLADYAANLIEAGLRAGEDPSILHDYVAWIRATPPDQISFSRPLIFMPLWRHPDNAKMVELAQWLFLAEDSPWHPIHELKSLNSEEIITSPLVGVPAFRELLKREFANTSQIGEFEVSRDSLSIEAMHASSGGSLIYKPDVEVPEKAKQPLRACDFYAVEISKLEGAPRYELYWPAERRDAVRKDMARFLDRWGNCFRDRSKSSQSNYDVFSTARFRLPRLAQPATAEDVAAGRAIFSLRDRPDAQVRVVPLKPYPRIARWKTLQQFPLLEPGVMEWPKDKATTEEKAWKSLPEEPFDREGLIWQAEEVLVDGTWRRYYGFVGNHVIAKAPAEEIDVLDGFSPAHPHR
jgi:hypothetical protein